MPVTRLPFTNDQAPQGCGGVGFNFRFARAVDQRGSDELVAGWATMQHACRGQAV